ncbi:hypothetical protein B0T22DRAFT_167526 [Podospora appendiculata]|uniref:Secreted protein n=1 Tax=Podospora appendiculata TaxID=314037 RepID=A0AAE1CD26_9PEZI|nr:hypothetical protein B0T22DRAFT_167526 [Podospora appendiculata]
MPGHHSRARVMLFCIPCAAVAAAMHLRLAFQALLPVGKCRAAPLVAWPLVLGGRGHPSPSDQTTTHHQPPPTLRCFAPLPYRTFYYSQRAAPLETFLFCVETRFSTAVGGQLEEDQPNLEPGGGKCPCCRRANRPRLPSALLATLDVAHHRKSSGVLC